jgi:hypothetical protein
VIPLNQLIPEGLLALGAAFLLGNLAAYVRLRPAWREAKEARVGRRGRSPAKSGNPRAASGNPRATSGNPRATSGNPRAKTGTSGRVNARVREPARSRSLPSRTRVLVNVMIGLVVTIAALAALIRG